MKNFSFGIVVFISMQTLHATLVLNKKCERELALLHDDAAKFFTEFAKIQDIAIQDVDEIGFNSLLLGMSLDSFAAVNYGADFDLNILQCILKQFVDIVSVKRVETTKKALDVEERCGSLVNMAIDFSICQNLVCRRGKLSGCEAELNQLRCDLSNFINILDKASSQAQKDIRGILQVTDSIGTLDKKFRIQYELTCNQVDPTPSEGHTCQCKRGNINNLKRDIKKYYFETRRTYDLGQVQVDNLTALCNNMTAAVDSWTSKLSA